MVGGRVVGLVAAKSNVNVYQFSEDCEGPGPAVGVPRWSIEPARSRSGNFIILMVMLMWGSH